MTARLAALHVTRRSASLNNSNPWPLPTLHQVIPVMESLTSRWEKKSTKPEYAMFHDALNAGISKLTKYYNNLNNTDVYILVYLQAASRSPRG